MQSLTVARSSLDEAMDDFPADCVVAAKAYLAVAKRLRSKMFWPVKMHCAVNLFLWHLDHFAKADDPRSGFIDVFNRATMLLESAESALLVAPADTSGVSSENFEQAVSGLFSDIWQQLSDDIYFDQSHDFTVERLTKNGIDPKAFFDDKTVLDAGCGSGKFSAAIARIGAAKVIGLDIGQKGLDFAKAQAQKVPYGDRLDYRYGSLIDIPLKDESIDIVWSNGVIHHTADYEKCVAEFARVLRPGGKLFLYVNGRFGLFELLVDTVRLSLQETPRELYIHFLSQLGVNSGRVYWITDHSYAPYEWKARKDVVSILEKHGFRNAQQLLRGVKTDQIELISSGLPFGEMKYGEAQLKFIAEKA